jgi:hypothetical protein
LEELQNDNLLPKRKLMPKAPRLIMKKRKFVKRRPQTATYRSAIMKE